MAILVVDDNAAGLYIKTRQLAALGYRVHEAANAASAMAVINAHPIDLAIIDVRLPDMSGIELCKLIKRRNASVLVLQTSAMFTAAVDRIAGLDQGADAYMIEPMDLAEFAANVRSMLRLRDAESQRELLMRELNHRVKNSLAIVQSLIGFTRRSVTSLDEFEALLIGRVHAMADAHDLLMQTNWKGADLNSIIDAVAGPFGISRFQLAGPAVWLAPNPAVRFGLAIHELATNASKHGALTKGDGHIEIGWATNTKAVSALDFSWIEIGGPEVRTPNQTEPGSILVRSLLAPDAEGEVHLDYLPGGLQFRVRISLSDRIKLV
jgi:two-component sensor histidine kinase